MSYLQTSQRTGLIFLIAALPASDSRLILSGLSILIDKVLHPGSSPVKTARRAGGVLSWYDTGIRPIFYIEL